MLVKLILMAAGVATFLSQVALGVNEASAFEQKCLATPPRIAEKIDIDWAGSVRTWYYPMCSRLHFYRMAVELLEIPFDEVKEDELYNYGGFHVIWEAGSSPVLNGFRGNTSTFSVTPIALGNYKFSSAYTGLGLTTWLSLTDNKTFQFFYNCYGDGQATWAVLSSVKTLDQETEKMIFEHAKSLGFNEKYFTRNRLDTCDEKTTQGKIAKSKSKPIKPNN